jgi:hypothetical protein
MILSAEGLRFSAALYRNISHFRENFSLSFRIRAIRELRGKTPAFCLPCVLGASAVQSLPRIWLRFPRCASVVHLVLQL